MISKAELGSGKLMVSDGDPGYRDRAGMTWVEEFEERRPMLFSIAYLILGSASEAEDVVHEAWLRNQRDPTRPTSLKEFLSAVVTRIPIDE